MKKLLLLLFIPFFCLGQLEEEDRLNLIYLGEKPTDKILCSQLSPHPYNKPINRVQISYCYTPFDRKFNKNNFKSIKFFQREKSLTVSTFSTFKKMRKHGLPNEGIVYVTVKITDLNQQIIYNKTTQEEYFSKFGEPVNEDNHRNSEIKDALRQHIPHIVNVLTDYANSIKILNIQNEIGTEKLKPTGEWAGNGSGLIISKSGYIVTNHHVIEDADDIEVEFIVDGEVQKFNAEIVQSDKVNDLAIIKIFDMNFDGLDNLPYNFKTRSSDVGTKVYAYGYPMALSLMGKEIKVTDGIISSKSGFGGDITSYQISAPIQSGNSGGPLFDSKGNFIGINSAGLSKDVADNVGYTIKSSYVLNLIDVLPKSIDLPSSTKLQSLPLTEQIKEISKYVVLVKVK